MELKNQIRTWIITQDMQLIASVGLLESSRKPLNIRKIDPKDVQFHFESITANDILIFHCGEFGWNESEILDAMTTLSGQISASRVIVIDDNHSSTRGVSFLMKGLKVYLTRPLNLNQLDITLELLRIQKSNNLVAQPIKRGLKSETLPESINQAISIDQDYLTDGGGENYDRILKSVMRVAKFDTTILLGGETGTGKSHLARIIHQSSDRKGKPFITINCAAISPTLFESELFGHVKGAFTGAESDRQGKLTDASEGTLFLDEIDSLPVALQAKLLRVFEEKVYEPVGSNVTLPMKARLIVASNRDLSVEVNEGRFRSDLYYRLNVVSFEIPPLRDRKSLIGKLLNKFLCDSSQRLGVQTPICTDETLDLIRDYDWPGNIRELRNVVERAVTLCDSNIITPFELTPELRKMGSPSKRESAQFCPVSARQSEPQHRLSDFVEYQEKEIIIESIRRNGFNLLRTSKDLGISRMTLYKKLDKYEIRRESLGFAS